MDEQNRRNDGSVNRPRSHTAPSDNGGTGKTFLSHEVDPADAKIARTLAHKLKEAEKHAREKAIKEREV